MYQHLLALQQHIFLIFTFELEGRGSGSNYWPYWMALCLVFLTAANVPHQYILQSYYYSLDQIYRNMLNYVFSAQLQFQALNNFMFAKHLDKINSLLNNTYQERQIQTDSIGLISNHMARTTPPSNSTVRPRSIHTTGHKLFISRDEVPENLEAILKAVFKAKCKDMKIEFNKRSWQLFLKTFTLKNKISQGELIDPCLNFSNFYLGPSCIPHLNTIIESSPFVALNLSKNLIDPTKLKSLPYIKELILHNCRLGNDVLCHMFQVLVTSQIKKISLSSPELKDRNQLTRYDKLIVLLKQSKTLETLNMSNIEIQPDNGIIQACKSSNLKHLDLSDNTNVKGISPSLISLNLSRNNITAPFELPLTPCLLQTMNLSYNKIPYYHFKLFLKNIYFPNLKHLILDHIQLSGVIYPIQQFIEASLSLTVLSMVECDLSHDSYLNITNGVKFNKSLKHVDLSRNRVTNEKIAENVGQMLQGGSVTHLRMRHCDIKDHLGAIIFTNIHKGKYIQSIDMMNNLLGDETARTLCKELKKAKTIVQLKLDQNIIKYKDQQQLQSYLEGNKHVGRSALDSQYRHLYAINKQQEEAERKLRQEDQKYQRLQSQTDQLEIAFYQKFKVCNEKKKIQLLKEINCLREAETELQQQLFIRDTMLVPSLHLNLSQKQTSFENPQIIQIQSPTPLERRSE